MNWLYAIWLRLASSRIYNSHSYPRYGYDFTINFLIWLWVHYLFRDLIIHRFANSLWFDYEFTILFAYSIWILVVSRILCKNTSFFTKSLSILYTFHIFTMNLLSFSRLDYEFTIFSWILYDLTMKSLSFRVFTLI